MRLWWWWRNVMLRERRRRQVRLQLVGYGDCMADPRWLHFMVGTLLNGNYAGVGGPNISPPAENWIPACVAAAPGGPNHVLLSDVVAEHIPGCNNGILQMGLREDRRFRS
jgi:O-antigen biosynthesis protein